MTEMLISERDRHHTTECLAVERYGHQSTYEPVDEIPEDSTHCPLCHLGVTQDEDKFAPVAVDLMRLNREDNEWSRGKILDSMRTLLAEKKERTHEQGHIADRTGISVKSVTHWKSERSGVSLTKRFDEELSDTLELNLIFYIVHSMGFGYTDVFEYIEECANGKVGLSSDQNIAKSVRWIQKYDPPSVLADVNEILEESADTSNEKEQQDVETDTDTAPESPTTSATQAPSTTDQGSNSQSNLSAFETG